MSQILRELKEREIEVSNEQKALEESIKNKIREMNEAENKYNARLEREQNEIEKFKQKLQVLSKRSQELNILSDMVSGKIDRKSVV